MASEPGSYRKARGVLKLKDGETIETVIKSLRGDDPELEAEAERLRLENERLLAERDAYLEALRELLDASTNLRAMRETGGWYADELDRVIVAERQAHAALLEGAAAAGEPVADVDRLLEVLRGVVPSGFDLKNYPDLNADVRVKVRDIAALAALVAEAPAALLEG